MVSTTRTRISFPEALRSKRNVMTAVILRDMRTRFFNHGLGFLIVSLWPLAHMLILLMIYSLTGRRTPFGDSLYVFFATGLIPTLAFMYISRFMSLSLILNRPMLAFPAVTVVDIMTARAFLEVVAAFITLILVVAIIYAIGDNPFPWDLSEAVEAYFATLLLAVGVGVLAGVIVMFSPFFATIYALMMILVYIGSGTLFVISSLPDVLSTPLSYNPVVHAVEWMRVAYYPTYSTKILDKEYLIGFGMTSLFLGLLLERVLRGKMLEG
ncbi:ABC transporter permease [Affinirhizobium pseudoryzae]|uniref:ABC transporter permease n=1 Tax=Allorhizobium pseudoryzae TaxID=379684 RepID=UPI001F332A79|nr:ABC transporter permease [Allorhizobium pseudoryzae]